MNLEGFCIFCGARIPLNTEKPVCFSCGGNCSGCSRSSPTISTTIYCHKCGRPEYVTEADPLCEECKHNWKSIIDNGN